MRRCIIDHVCLGGMVVEAVLDGFGRGIGFGHSAALKEIFALVAFNRLVALLWLHSISVVIKFVLADHRLCISICQL